jgi:hypothetical protein
MNSGRLVARERGRLAVSPRTKSLEERFWAKVVKCGTCWLWTGALKGGYGIIRINPARTDTRRAYAHRVAWQLAHGPVPNDMRLVRRCQTVLCVNPAHYALVSEDEQVEEMVRTRRLRGQTDA